MNVFEEQYLWLFQNRGRIIRSIRDVGVFIRITSGSADTKHAFFVDERTGEVTVPIELEPDTPEAREAIRKAARAFATQWRLSQ